MLRVVLFLALASVATIEAAEEKAVLEVGPTLAELSDGWTTNVVACVLDPRSNPPEVDYFNGQPSRLLEFHREEMKKDGRTGYATIHYRHRDAGTNQALYRVYIQRWGNTRSLHNRWVDWKMTPARIVRSVPPVGEDCFWSDDGMFQEFAFRRGLFHVVVQAGSASDYRPMIELAEVIDARIRDKPIRKPKERKDWTDQ